MCFLSIGSALYQANDVYSSTAVKVITVAARYFKPDPVNAVISMCLFIW